MVVAVSDTPLRAVSVCITVPDATCINCLSGVIQAAKDKGIPDADITPKPLFKSVWIACENATQADALIHEIQATDETIFSSRILNDDSNALPDSLLAPPARMDASKQLLLRALLAGLIGLPLLILELLNVIPHPMGLVTQLINGAIGLITLIVMIVTGWAFFKKAWQEFKNKTAGMNTLIVLGLSITFIFSVVVCIVPSIFPAGFAHPHFSSVAMILMAANLGEAIKSFAKKKSIQAAGSPHDFLSTHQSQTAHRLSLDTQLETTIPYAEIQKQDYIVVHPGETYPVDGMILGKWQATKLIADEPIKIQATIETGEETPVIASRTVLAGMKNVDTLPILIVATTKGTQGYVCRTVKQLLLPKQKTNDAKLPKQKSLVDKLSAYFTPAVIVLSIAALIAWICLDPISGWAYGISAMVNVLLCACPCGWMLSVPSSYHSATMYAMKRHLYIFDDSIFEKIPARKNMRTKKTPTYFIFDKSGTLVTLTLQNPATLSEYELQLLAALEKESSHPIAKAILKISKPADQPLEALETAHNGRQAKINGLCVQAGNRAYFEALGIHTFPPMPLLLSDDQKPQVVYVKIGEAPLKVLCFAETIRPEAKNVIDKLKADQIHPIILTGDTTPGTTERVAKELGITEWHIKRPQEKAAFIEALKAKEKNAFVFMVGDGENDIHALNQADVGIALGRTAGINQAAAITLPENLNDIPKIFEVVEKTRTNISQNLYFVLIYNAISIVLAAGVLLPLIGIMLHPAILCTLMLASSLFVMLNAARLSYQLKDEEDRKRAIQAAVQGDQATLRQTIQNKLSTLNHFEKMLITGFIIFGALTTAGIVYSVVSGMSIAHLISMMTVPATLASCACCATLLGGLVGLGVMLALTLIYVSYRLYQTHQQNKPPVEAPYQTKKIEPLTQTTVVEADSPRGKHTTFAYTVFTSLFKPSPPSSPTTQAWTNDGAESGPQQAMPP